MNDHDNNLRQQCASLAELAMPQSEGALQGVMEAIPKDILLGFRSIILTGCGDSFMAANIALASFRHYAQKFGNVFEAVRCVEFSRNFRPHAMSDPSATLLIAISASGSPARIQEAILHARSFGIKSMLVTNSPTSPSAKLADYILNVHTPAFDSPGPGLRNYYANLTGLFLFSAYFGECKGIVKVGSTEKLARDIVDYTKKSMDSFSDWDESAYSIMTGWSHYDSFDCIGDDIYYFNASFIRAKFVETAGVMVSLTDSENWCHVHFFHNKPQQNPLITVCSWGDPNHSRIIETIHQAKAVGRPLAIITTNNSYEITENDVVFVYPQATENRKFMECLVNYIPGALLAGYYASMTEEPYFRGGGVWSEGTNNTIKTSQIKIGGDHEYAKN